MQACQPLSGRLLLNSSLVKPASYARTTTRTGACPSGERQRAAGQPANQNWGAHLPLEMATLHMILFHVSLIYPDEGYSYNMDIL